MTKIKVPAWVRSTDLREECSMRWILQHLHADELPEAGYFVLGTAVHNAIEHAIVEDLTDPDRATAHAWAEITDVLEEHDPATVIWGTKRTADTIYDDAEMLVNNWFDAVHPDSPVRIEPYPNYDWPPRVELEIRAEIEPGPYTQGFSKVETRTDALFTNRHDGPPMLIDWKTGVKTGGDKDSQLWVYKWGLQLPDDTLLAFHYVAGKAVRYAQNYPGDAVIETMIERHLMARRMELFVPQEGWYCKNHCRVKQWCPLFGGEGALRAIQATDWDWDHGETEHDIVTLPTRRR